MAGPARNPVEARVQALQSSIGNAAVGAYLQRLSAGEEAGGAAPTTHALLKFGARGPEVEQLQSSLNGIGAAAVPLAVDGIYGRRTQAAVRRFQRAHPPLAVDGDAGTETWKALEAAPVQGGVSGDQAADEATTAADPWALGKEHYAEGRYGRAYDQFTIAHEASGDPAHLFNRAQALRLLGGRRDEAIALYEQFLATDADADDERSNARKYIEELRGPGRSGDVALDKAMVNAHFRAGRERYGAEEYALAYDEFSKAHEITGDPALLWNRAQALRLVGGRRSEAIALYEQVLVAPEIPEDNKAAARTDIAELRGAGKTGDEKADGKAVDEQFAKGRQLFADEQYAQAYDAFSKAYEVSGDPGMLYNRAQALRLLGGRRAEAIALYEQVVAANVPEESKKSARAHLADLRGAARGAGGGAGSPAS
jgi:tetratricopeptide (TPR) repeat protein